MNSGYPIHSANSYDDKFDTELLQHCSKQNLNTHIIKERVLNHFKLFYKEKIKIYTDGSVMRGKGAAAAFSIPDQNVTGTYRLNPLTPPILTELWAIHQALSWLSSNKQSDAVIFCDCMFAMRSISIFNIKVFPATIPDILKCY